MAQQALTFGPGYEGRQAWLAQLELLRAAVGHLVAKDVADQLDTNRSTLSEALNEQRDRRWAGEWTHTVKAMLAARHDDPVAADLLHRICQSDTAAAPSVMTVEMTDEEREDVECFLETRRRRKAKKR
jgi:hypothetical protein